MINNSTIRCIKMDRFICSGCSAYIYGCKIYQPRRCEECRVVEEFCRSGRINSTIINKLPAFLIKMKVDCMTLEKYWDQITDDEKKQELEEYRPCYDHYNTGRTHWDGPPDSKMKCNGCQEQKM